MKNPITENEVVSEDEEPSPVFQQRKRKLEIVSKPPKRSRDEFESSLSKNWREEVKVIDGLRIPRALWSKLRAHQKAGVVWLWKRIRGNSGGILGDEMGLGKTVQIISLCVGMFEGNFNDPILIIVPCTLQRQWMQEFIKWWPLLNVKLISSGKKFRPREKTVYVTGYERARTMDDQLVDNHWGLVVCDEGHRLRNQKCQTTRTIKLVSCDARFILSGSPIMNNLSELWSLVDFVQPGLLGKHQVFNEQLAIPISQGSHANSSPLQIATALRCAEEVRSLIKPVMLRRLKSQVDLVVSEKQEHVLFIKMTKRQANIYNKFLDSDAVKKVINGDSRCFSVLSQLRKVRLYVVIYK